MSAKSPGPDAGFLGRNPWFWAGAFIATSCALGGLSFSGAIEGRGTILLLLLVPLGLLGAVSRSAQKSIAAKQSQGGRPKLAQTRYVRRVAIFTSLYLATFAFMTFANETFEIPDPIRYLIAILPGLAISGMFWAIGRLIIEEEDEFVRTLTVRQTLIASGFALSAASIWGVLEAADLVVHLDAYWVAVAWFLGLIIGAISNFVQHDIAGAV